MKRSLIGWWMGVLVLALLGGALAGCGGSSSGTEAITGVRLSPGTVTLRPGALQQFTAVVNGPESGALVWRVNGGDANGTVTTGGLYTAPTTPGRYEIVAALASNPARFGLARVVVNGTIGIEASLPEGFTRVNPGFNVNLRAQVTGAGDPSVRWSVTGGATNGTVSATGVYTAPSRSGVYEVVAASTANPDITDTVSVLVSNTACVRLVIANKGDVVLQMATAEAPITTANFLKLTREAYYNGTAFHRYENLNPGGDPAFIIQGGDPKSATLPIDDPSLGTHGPGYTIPFERTGLTHVKYALAMARTNDPDSAGGQFYICQNPAPFLDPDPSSGRVGYAVFGRVIGGFSVVDSLRKGDRILTATEIP